MYIPERTRVAKPRAGPTAYYISPSKAMPLAVVHWAITQPYPNYTESAKSKLNRGVHFMGWTKGWGA